VLHAQLPKFAVRARFQLPIVTRDVVLGKIEISEACATITATRDSLTFISKSMSVKADSDIL
jgi:hypothetical protein